MRALGAAEVCRRGDGDDDACIDDDLDKWKDELYAALDASSDLLGSKVDQAAAAANGGGAKHAVPTYDVQMHKAGTREAQPFPQGDGTSASHPYWAKLATVRELHASASDRSCVHVEIDISGCRGLSYSHGDHVGVYAQNGPQVVEAVAALLQQPLDTVFTLRRPDGDAAGSADLPDPFPGPLSLRTALSYFADVTSSPHKEALLALAEFATEPSEAERLRRLGSHDGKQDYADYVAKPHRSLLEVMTEFKSARPSLGAFFGVIAPRLQPRYYSISSSPRQHPASVHVTCAVVRSAMPTGRVHDGICSTWFQRATAGARVPVFIRSSHFRLPADPAAPVVMVGPGTGLAPFRGFLQERAALAAAGAKLGPAHLFFGCRSRGHDYIYEEELAAALKAGWLSHLHVAFSRDQASKDYVQHHVAAHAAEVWAVLSHPGGAAYVCGDAKHMAKDVHRALIQVVQDHKRCSGTQAEGFVKELQDAGRYLRDVW